MASLQQNAPSAAQAQASALAALCGWAQSPWQPEEVVVVIIIRIIVVIVVVVVVIVIVILIIIRLIAAGGREGAAVVVVLEHNFAASGIQRSWKTQNPSAKG